MKAKQKNSRMEWIKASDKLPKKEKIVVTYDPHRMFEPKWFTNTLKKDGSWLLPGNITHWFEPVIPEPEGLTIEEIEEIFKE